MWPEKIERKLCTKKRVQSVITHGVGLVTTTRNQLAHHVAIIGG